MIPATSQGYSQPFTAQTAGWVASCLLHAGLLLGAVVFVRHVQLAPQPTPFTWDVAMVSTAREAAAPTAQTPNAQPSQIKPTNATMSAPPRTVPLKPQPTAVQPIQSPAPVIAPTSPPPAPIQELKPIIEPSPPIATPMPPIQPAEPMVQERVAPRPVEPPHRTTQIESLPVSPRIERITPPEVQAVGPVAPPPAATIAPAVPNVETPAPAADAGPSAEIAPTPTATAPQVAAITPVISGKSTRTDYGWLSETILRRVEELKRYPAEARLDRAEGKVVLRAVIRDDGSVDDVEVFQSSGYRSLDMAAVELMKQAAPFHLPHPLGKSNVTVKIPMSYRLDR